MWVVNNSMGVKEHSLIIIFVYFAYMYIFNKSLRKFKFCSTVELIKIQYEISSKWPRFEKDLRQK